MEVRVLLSELTETRHAYSIRLHIYLNMIRWDIMDIAQFAQTKAWVAWISLRDTASIPLSSATLIASLGQFTAKREGPREYQFNGSQSALARLRPVSSCRHDRQSICG